MKKLLAIASLLALIAVVFKVEFKRPETAISLRERSANADDTTQMPTATNPPTRKRHQIAVKVSDPSEILVKAGQSVVAGQIVAERRQKRAKLEAQRRSLALSLEQARRPLPLPPRPIEDYSVAIAEIDAAQVWLSYVQQKHKPDFRYRPQHRVNYDRKIFDERQELAEQEIEAQARLNAAHAALTQCKNSYQNALHAHQLKLLEIEQAQRNQEIETLKLAQELSRLDEQITQLAAIRSPYTGEVRRVQVTGQSGSEITALVSLVITE